MYRLISAAAGLIELTLNPAPVYVHRLSGKVTSREEAAQKVSQATGKTVPAAAISYMYYDEETDQTVVEFGAFPGVGVNPFAFREIRFALNYVVDRSTFAANVMRGFAVPMYTFLSQYDPDYAVIADIIAKYEFEYNPSKASAVVNSVMTSIGAQLINNVWYYGGQPVTVTLIIRPEDERRDLGYMFEKELKLLGFNTNPQEKPFAEAINIVYGTDPKEFQWHVYTAGWGKGGIDRYDSGTIAQFCAPWVGYMPGWGEPTFWNYKNDTIDNITLKNIHRRLHE
jgi:peptide/nickel transport system substrate-binding protein